MNKFPKDLLTLVQFLKKLPGVGTKTAQRFAFSLLQWKDMELLELAKLIENIKKNNPPCPECGCLMQDNICFFCTHRAQSQTLCILSSPKEVFSFEETQSFKGLYHVIEHLLSPMDHFDEKGINIELIKKRIEKYQIKEVILALDSTLEGDATSLYIKQELEGMNINISRLAFGLPLGSSLEYIDAGTLTRALSGRQSF